jgi:hypothetical protein
VPHFAVGLDAPDLRPWLDGNCGIPGVWSFAAAAPGPHLVKSTLWSPVAMVSTDLSVVMTASAQLFTGVPTGTKTDGT